MNLDCIKLAQSQANKVTFDIADELRMVIEPHAPGVFRIRLGAADELAHDMPTANRAKQRAQLLIARPEAISECETQELLDRSGWELTQGDVCLKIGKDSFGISLERGGRHVMAFTPDGIGHDDGHWSFGVQLDQGMAVYGLGQTRTDLNRRSEYIVSDDPAHAALPLAWSPSGWGLYVNTMGRVDHDIGVTNTGIYEVHAQSSSLDLFVFAGDPSEILNQYTAITGRAGQVALWAMGAWVRQSQNTTATQIIEQFQMFRANGIALDNVLMRPPMAWTLTESKLNLEWDGLRFPDPKQVLDLFESKSIHVALPALPAVRVDTPTFEELADRGWLLAQDDGDTYVLPGCEVTAGVDFALLDLTHRDVYKQWVERHRQLADEGVAAILCDAQFDIADEVTARGGESGSVLRTIYPTLVRQALFEACAGHKVPPEGLVLTHDLVPGAQRYPWQAPASVEFTWAGMRESLISSLSTGSSGIPVHMQALGSPDMPSEGFDSELLLRWLALCVFSGNFQIENPHALLASSLTAQQKALIAQWMQWRYRLIPYALGALEDATRTGLPLQRSMALAFAQDATSHQWDTQYMFGPAVLVAPVMQPGNRLQVYLPSDDAWWDLRTGWRYEGGQTLELDVGLDSMAVFGREGHMLCLGPATLHTGDFNSARILDEVWMFGMPVHNPVVMRNKIRVMQMQGSSYIKGLEGLKILPSQGLEVKRRGAEVRISRAR